MDRKIWTEDIARFSHPMDASTCYPLKNASQVSLGVPVPLCWIGLSLQVAAGSGLVYTERCAEDSAFVIDYVPAANYNLAARDKAWTGWS